MTPSSIDRLKFSIQEFEDRKITGADLSRRIFNAARDLHEQEDSGLRRSLEGIGNKISVITERGRAQQSYRQVLDLVDEICSALVERGY